MMQLASAQGNWAIFHRQHIGMAAAYAVCLSLVPPPQREGERITPLFEAMGIRPVCSSLLSSAENIVQNRPEKEQPCPPCPQDTQLQTIKPAGLYPARETSLPWKAFVHSL